MKKVIKSIYNLVPCKKQLFQTLKLVYKPSKRVYRHLHFKGPFTVEIEKGKSFRLNHYGFVIENEIFWDGVLNGWEKYSMRIWKELCKDANVIFDIGANTGVYSLIAKTINPNAKVYAFEPVERVYNKLLQNVHLNHYNIQCVQKAISNSTGKAVIYDSDSEHTLSVAVNKNISLTPEKTFEVEISTITLDDFISENKINGIQLMKIDVETHEVEVMEGFKNHLKQFEPNFLIEILTEEIANRVEKLIEGMNYVYFNIDENKGVREVSHLGKSDYYNFLICKPSVAEKIRVQFCK